MSSCPFRAGGGASPAAGSIAAARPPPRTPCLGSRLVGTPGLGTRLCLCLCRPAFAHGRVTATPPRPQGHPGRVPQLPRPGLAWSCVFPACRDSALQSPIPPEQPCGDPRRDRGPPPAPGRETGPSCLPGSHQSAKASGHVATEARPEGGPGNAVRCPGKGRCSAGCSK